MIFIVLAITSNACSYACDSLENSPDLDILIGLGLSSVNP
jgi:hypothetical protein